MNDRPGLLCRRPILLALLVAAALLALGPRTASAHATVLSSQPQPGQRLQNTPGVVVLSFSEPLNTQLSRANVSDPGGRSFRQSSVSPGEIRVAVDSSSPGVYQVTWTAVSAADGHTLRGGFRFGVRVSAGAPEEQSQALPLPPDLLLAVPRALEYGSLFAALGMLLLTELARRRRPERWVRPPLRAVLCLALVSGAGVVLSEALAACGGTPGLLSAYLLGDPPGWVRLARVTAELAALGVALRWPRLAALPLLLAFAALAAAGHAAAMQPAAPAVLTDAVHLVFGGLWAGGILALATLRPPGGWLGPEARMLLSRFTPVALAAFGVSIATGLLRALVEVGGVQQLLGSAYGLVLGLKAMAILAMLPLSLLAWRRLRPAPRLEGLFVLAVLGGSAVLASFPLPPDSLARAQAERAAAGPDLALPSGADLTLGSDAGTSLVALTLRPGRPGPNQAWLYVMPLGGESAASRLDVSVRLAGRDHPVRRCGPACRTLGLQLQGGETLGVRVAGTGGGTASFALPQLPAPDANGLVDRLQTRLHGLRSYAVDETLGPGRVPLRSTYTFQAPDRMRLDTSTGYRAVAVGATRYSRESSGARWQIEAAPALTVPDFVWDGAQIVSPRTVAAGSVDGRPVESVSFFEMSGEMPAWFQLTVDAQGLVTGSRMRAQGHFMEQRYFDFDAPLAIEPPVGSG